MQTTTEQQHIIPGIMDKIRAIKDKISLETFDMSFQELSEYLKPHSQIKEPLCQAKLQN